MKKRWLVLIMVACLLTASAGCSLSRIELTDSENDAIAEYAAYLLLKYDKNYNPQLMYREEFDEMREALNATPTPAPAVTEAPEGGGSQATGEDEGSGEDGGTVTVNEITGFKKISLRYLGSSVIQEYTTNSEYFSIEAPEGKKILVCRFEFENSNDKARSLKTAKLGLNYKLRVSDKAILDARISLLENDIQYIDTELEAGQKYEAVLLFFVDDSYLDEQMLLSVGNGGKTAEIEIKQ